MTVARAQGQARAAWARATARVEGPSWRTASLLPLLRALAPAHHAGAADDVVDVAFLARCRAVGGDALLAANGIHLSAARDRAARCVTRGEGEVLLSIPCVDDGLLWVAGLALEAAKLQHGLPARPDDLKAHFDTPHSARAALQAVHQGGADRSVVVERAGASAAVADLKRAAGDRPVVVVCGAVAGRVHDLLSPQPRRLRRELLAAVEAGARAGDDAVYGALAALHRADAGAHAERVATEERDGLVPCGDVVVVQTDRANESLADRRLGQALQQAKRARVAVVVCALDDDLDVVLRAFPAAPIAAGVLGSAAAVPRAVIDVASEHVALVDNALADATGASRSAATPLLWPADDEGHWDVGGFALLQHIQRPVAEGVRDHARVAFITAPADDAGQSQGALALLQALVASLEPRPRRR